MTRTIRVEVTAEHIAKGVPAKPCECPVALALCSAGLLFPAVDGETIEWQDRWNRIEPCPSSVREFITAFDDGKPVEPFTFEIEVET